MQISCCKKLQEELNGGSLFFSASEIGDLLLIGFTPPIEGKETQIVYKEVANCPFCGLPIKADEILDFYDRMGSIKDGVYEGKYKDWTTRYI